MEGHSEQLDRNVPGLQRDSNIHNQREREGHGPDVQQRSEAAFECTSGGGQNDGDHDDPVQSGRSRGKSRCFSYTSVRIDRHQSRRKAGLTELLDVLHLRSNSRRAQPRHLLPSKPSWNPSRASMLNIRFVSTFYPCLPSNNSIPRTPSVLRTRSNSFAYVSPHWRSFSGSPQVMRRKPNFAKDYQCMQLVFVQTRCLNVPRKLQNIEGQLRSLRGKSASLRFLDNAQDGEDVRGLLEDLQEAVNDYMVRSWS